LSYNSRMSDFPFTEIDHVQLAMPVGEEAAARRFYCEIVGMAEIAKPPELAKRGGAWFVSGQVQIHLGVEDGFRPARKAHPALRSSNYELLLGKLRGAGVSVREDDNISGVQRCHIQDPFGNRIELIKS
jgi:catechol 2,3-dioxygenase-like lactoylglutathione lyase family enzyme